MSWTALAACLAVFLFVLMGSPVRAGDAPPPMVLPGKFGVSATGAATYSIPITVPPGTAGMAPALSLDYSSENGDGIVGLGWALSGLPTITRCPRTVAQDGVHGGVNYDQDASHDSGSTNDRFCLDGQRLIMISGAYYGADGSEYRTEIDSFSRIVAHYVGGTPAGNGPAWFEVHTKTGIVMEFGHTTDSQVLATGLSTARAWAIDKISDLKGNYLSVIYNSNTSTGYSDSVCTMSARTAYGIVCPTEIDYTGNSGASLSPYNSVRFVYDTRLDTTSYYQAGTERQLTLRLKNIQTFNGVIPSTATKVLDYALAYNSDASTTKRSRLVSVTLCDSALANCFPATTFGWSNSCSRGFRRSFTISMATASRTFFRIQL